MNCITLSNALLIHLLVIVYNSSKFFIRYDVMMVDVFQCWESNIQQVTFNPPRIPPGVQFVPANPNVPEKCCPGYKGFPAGTQYPRGFE